MMQWREASWSRVEWIQMKWRHEKEWILFHSLKVEHDDEVKKKRKYILPPPFSSQTQWNKTPKKSTFKGEYKGQVWSGHSLSHQISENQREKRTWSLKNRRTWWDKGVERIIRKGNLKERREPEGEQEYKENLNTCSPRRFLLEFLLLILLCL